MTFKDKYNFDILVNEAENLVIDELEKQLEEENNKDICKCEDCILDMAAFALNHLVPKYMASYTGRIYALQYQEGQYKKEVTENVKKAIKKISSNPAHG
ncbi:MAG: late competence development ComFB family protein [Spirochaetes bacterium]|nr:late competence development ComFB family protein [Spirochaetota bacterium]